jgi:HEAT repeat protein
MPKHHRFLIFALTFILVISFSLPWVSAKKPEPEKPKPQDWQINGIVAALDDGYPEVQRLGFDKITEYEFKDFERQKVDDIAKKAVKVLKDKNIDRNVRVSAAGALGNLGDAAKPYVKNIVDIFKDKNIDSSVRSSAATALWNLGDAAKPYVKDIADILKDKNANPSVRSSAADALGNLGELAKPYVKDIADILKDKNANPSVRSSAADALGNLGELAKPYVKDIADILKDKNADSDVRSSAARALGSFGDAAKPYAKDIFDIIKDKDIDPSVRSDAATALGNLGETAKPYIRDIVDILKDKNADLSVRGSAATALGSLGELAKPYVKDIVDILKDKNADSSVRSDAATALGNLGETAKPYIKDIADILKDKNTDSGIRSSAADALGNLGDLAKPYIEDILNFIKDKNADSDYSSYAATALGNLGSIAQPYVKDIAEILKDEKIDISVRSGAASALGNMGEAGAKFFPDILDFLKNENAGMVRKRWGALIPEYRSIAAMTLGKIRKLELIEVSLVINPIYYRNQFNIEQWRFYSYFLGGGTEEVKILLTWLGKPEIKSIPEKLTRDKAIKALDTFLTIWQPSQDLAGLREDLAEKTSLVVSQKQVTWQPQDILLLEKLKNNLNKAGYGNKASAIESTINSLQFWGGIYRARNIILLHIAFWLTLILFYPKSPHIQAIFFWNPWVRRILGMGYVGFLLTWVPYFRRKLLEPFKFPLLADAGLDHFNPNAYFPESYVNTDPSPNLSPAGREALNLAPLPLQGRGWGLGQDIGLMSISQIIPKIQGQIIIEGASGLGKTMFLRHLLNNSSRTVVYLPAQKCQKGVIEAIQAKLHGQAQDTDFLRSLIYSGAIDICIDGINEVNAETRAKICQFVETNFQGNIIMTTQPLEWIAPATAKTYYIQPLTPNQVDKFLLSRVSRLPKDSPVQGKDYEEACKKFLKTVLDSSNLNNSKPSNQQSSEEIIATMRILSNPMDLSLVSLMLSQNKEPNLFNLQQQQYNLMSAEYLRERGYEFPLKKFSQEVYQMRLNDESALCADEFYKELESMEDEKYKMVVSRQWMQDDEDKIGHELNKNMKEWYFRHDKIMEFFLVQNFLGNSDEIEARLLEHIGDSRFRGVYFLLANLLPLDDAKELREELIQYAADTKDHNVSDTFVQLLRSR